MWVGYIRVSDVGEREGDSFRSPRDQAAAIRGWAKARGVKVEVLPPELDESGGRDDRPIFMQALEGIEAGKYEGIVAQEQSRFMRETAYLLVMVDAVHAVGGQIEVVEGAVDWETPEGRMFGTIKGAFDEHFRRDKARKFEHYRKSSVERGIWKFRQTPLGYSRDPDTRKLVPNDDAPKVRVAFMARMKSPPVPISELAEKLTMTPAGVRRLLANRVYLGEIHVGPHANRNAHPPLIDLETFDAVQTVKRTRPKRGKGEPALLSGLVRCAACGHMMSVNRNTDRYACRTHHSAGRCPRPAGIKATGLDGYVTEIVREVIEDMRVTTGRRSDQGDQLRDTLAKAQAELAAFLSATEAAGLPLESFASGARQRQDAIDSAQAALEQHHTLKPLGGLFESGSAFWDDLNAHEKNKLLRGLVDAVVVCAVGRGRPVPHIERVRVFGHGTLPEIQHIRGSTPKPIRALPFPELNDERLLGVTGLKDRLRNSGG